MPVLALCRAFFLAANFTLCRACAGPTFVWYVLAHLAIWTGLSQTRWDAVRLRATSTSPGSMAGPCAPHLGIVGP